MPNTFQVKLAGDWKDYSGAEDKIMKRAYLAGFPNAKYTFRGQEYGVNFRNMTQKNMKSEKEREIRPPHKWKAPERPIVPAGPTFCVKVPPGAPGTTIQVPNPKKKDESVSVNVPASAKVGAAMLVPVGVGAAVAGAVLGEHIAEEGWDATMADLGDVADDAGEAIADGAEDAVDWAGDAADSAGDFVMDLF